MADWPTLDAATRQVFDWYKDHIQKQRAGETLAFWTQPTGYFSRKSGAWLLAFVAFDTDDMQPNEAPHTLAIADDRSALETLQAALIAELPADRTTTGVICR